jgi:nitroreductase
MMAAQNDGHQEQGGEAEGADGAERPPSPAAHTHREIGYHGTWGPSILRSGAFASQPSIAGARARRDLALAVRPGYHASMSKPTATADLFEVMYSCRAMRRLKPDPVPEELLVQLVDAAIQGPSGSNAQTWRFVIVRDRTKLREVQLAWEQGWRFYRETVARAPTRPGEDLEARERMTRAVEYMVEHLDETPAVIFACVREDAVMTAVLKSGDTWRAAVRHFGVAGTLRFVRSGLTAGAQGMDASIYPGVQNLLLAARALGLGATLTTPHLLTPGIFERLLRLPRHTKIAAAIPVGWPKGRFGPVSRPAARDVISWDTAA